MDGVIGASSRDGCTSFNFGRDGDGESVAGVMISMLVEVESAVAGLSDGAIDDVELLLRERPEPLALESKLSLILWDNIFLTALDCEETGNCLSLGFLGGEGGATGRGRFVSCWARG
jgi:hypothetical protein